jgi:hypothetical protein
MNEYGCTAAAENGHAETLRWLQEANCPWNALLISEAAVRGRCAAVAHFLLASGLVGNSLVQLRAIADATTTVTVCASSATTAAAAAVRAPFA